MSQGLQTKRINCFKNYVPVFFDFIKAKLEQILFRFRISKNSPLPQPISKTFRQFLKYLTYGFCLSRIRFLDPLNLFSNSKLFMRGNLSNSCSRTVVFNLSSIFVILNGVFRKSTNFI